MQPARRRANTSRAGPDLRLVDTSSGLTAAAAAPPPFREATLVSRPRLVARLADARDAQIVLIVAPVGYGKTTLLTEWAHRSEDRFTWLTLGERHNDAAALAADLEPALDEIWPAKGVLVLDDVHSLHSPEALDALTGLAERIPQGARLALASRTAPDLPLARLRAERRLVEVRARDLTMTRSEGAAVLALAGLDLPQLDTERLMTRTEGWPAGLYLATLSAKQQSEVAAAVPSFAGDDLLVADYLRDELVTPLPHAAVAFLRRTSVLDELTGSVCDAVLERRGSARRLSDLARCGALLVPLDRSGSSYRCHRLFREMLRGELRRLEPELEPTLRRRASAWHAAHGDPARAIQHAIAAGDPALAGDLLWANITDYVEKGRALMVRHWLGAFTHEQIAAHPSLALTAADTQLALGDAGAAQRWSEVAAHALAQSPPDARPRELEAGAGVLGAAACGRLAAMHRGAVRAYQLVHEDSPWRAHCCLLTGVAHQLRADPNAARPALEEGARRAAAAAPRIQTLCLSQLALLAADEDDVETGADYAARASAQLEHYGLTGYPTAALVFAVSAWMRARTGRLERARDEARQAKRLLEQLTDFVPWYGAEAHVALARCEIRLGDAAAARALLATASRLAKRVPEAVLLPRWIQATEEQLQAVPLPAPAGTSPLTAAELRVLGFMPTHLSFREIAACLCVSANTVKTQAHAVYRKLDASSRSEAVEHARERGLLDAAA